MQGNLNSFNVLLVEDSPGDVRLIKESLAEGELSHKLHVVSDGEEAMDFLRRQGRYSNEPRPDLILLDLNLPKKDGREVLSNIKGDPELKNIPTVVLTTSDSEQDIIMTYEHHANCYITKPVNLEQFIKVVNAIERFWLSIVKLPGSV